MDIEKLTKTQIVLLVLLVSFVTSIATGIVTVTLMDQAPPAVTQTINRVVERTVERVIPNKNQEPNVVTKEVTVTVTEEDLIADAIEKNTKSLVRIFEHVPAVDEVASATNTFVGLGIVAMPEGLIATDRSILKEGRAYRISIGESRSLVDAEIAYTNEEIPVALLSPAIAADAEMSFFPVLFSDLSAIRLGQTVIALSGETHTRVLRGIISGLPTTYRNEQESPDASLVETSETEKSAKKSSETPTQLGSIISRFIGSTYEEGSGEANDGKSAPALPSAVETSITGNSILPGSPLIDTSGNVVGMSVLSLGNTSIYVPAYVITATLAALAEVAPTETSDE